MGRMSQPNWSYLVDMSKVTITFDKSEMPEWSIILFTSIHKS